MVDRHTLRVQRHKLLRPPKADPKRRRLTDRFVKSVTPASIRTLYWDTVQRGLVLAVEATGHRSYKLYYRYAGRPRWYHIADARAIGLKDAREVARQKLADVVKGIDVQAEKLAARRADTFEEVANRYRDEYAKVRNKSWEQSDFLVRRYLLPKLGGRRIQDVRRSEIRAIIRELTEAGKPILANQLLAAASRIFSWAMANEVAAIPANPCAGIERNPSRSRERVLSEAEMPLFWSATDEVGLIRGRALRMILLTGQRPGEIRCMRREHIDGQWWSLPGEPDERLGWPGTKNAQSHRVWLSQPAMTIINELGDGNEGFVFAGRRGVPVSGLDAAMRAINTAMGIKKPDKITPHDLRRTHGTLITSLGFARDQMNRLQNHKEGGIASVYDRHSYAEEHCQIQEAVAARLGALIGDPYSLPTTGSSIALAGKSETVRG